MCISIKMVALLLALSSVVAVGQDCDALKSGSVSAAVEFLRHAGDEAGAPSCVNQAFHVIASSPPEQALPLLVERLG